MRSWGASKAGKRRGRPKDKRKKKTKSQLYKAGKRRQLTSMRINKMKRGAENIMKETTKKEE